MKFIEKSHRQFNELNGNMGTESEPVVIPWDWDKTSVRVMYRLVHAHDNTGKCQKNRYGVFCDE